MLFDYLNKICCASWILIEVFSGILLWIVKDLPEHFVFSDIELYCRAIFFFLFGLLCTIVTNNFLTKSVDLALIVALSSVICVVLSGISCIVLSPLITPGFVKQIDLSDIDGNKPLDLESNSVIENNDHHDRQQHPDEETDVRISEPTNL